MNVKKKKHYWWPLDLRSWDQCNKIFKGIIYKTVYFSQYNCFRQSLKNKLQESQVKCMPKDSIKEFIIQQ